MRHPFISEPLEHRRLFSTLPAHFADTTVVGGLSSPTSVAVLPDGRWLVTEQGGALRVVQNDRLLSTPALRLNVNGQGEGGLLSVAADPQFGSNHYVYAFYTPAGHSPVYNQVSRFTLNGATVAGGSEKVLLKLPPLANGSVHVSGAMHFGRDGKLYIATGDNALDSQKSTHAQSLASLEGKLLRINADGSIPSDNPFYGRLTGNYRAIYSYGLRDPYSFATDLQSGRIYVNDVGTSRYDEIDAAAKGANFGWPANEGPTSLPYVSPVYSYKHVAGTNAVITGGVFYTAAKQFPSAYAGRYFFGDYSQGVINTFDPATKQEGRFASGVGSVIDLDVGPDGSLLYLTRGGAIHRIRYAGPSAPTPTGGTASIAGYVVSDKNRNGKWDSGEAGIAGRTVWLDLDNDAVRDTDEPTQMTATNGRFTFSGLTAGSYKVREVVPSGFVQTLPTNDFGLAVTLTAGQPKSGLTFLVRTA